MLADEDQTVRRFQDRASGMLLPEPPPTHFDISGHPGPSDFALNPDHDRRALLGPGTWPKPAAVLVPILERDGRASVLLTLRADTMRAHAGQIAFPGGRADDADDGPAVTALREAREEIGLMPEQVTVLGFLDPYLTGTGYLVFPVVAVVGPGFRARPAPGEVAEVFDIPLGFLMDPANHKVHVHKIDGRSRSFVAMAFGDRYVWGATAGMLKNLYDRIYC